MPAGYQLLLQCCNEAAQAAANAAAAAAATTFVKSVYNYVYQFGQAV
jgi:hypothetical protein